MMYKYHAREDHFGEDLDQSIEITAYVNIICESSKEITQ